MQFALNLAWSPLFFRAHQVGAALGLILVLALLVALTTALFWRIRPFAGALMLPYLVWLVIASALNWQIDRRNPDAETLVPPAHSTQIKL